MIADHGPTFAPAPRQTSPNLLRTPTTRIYIPSGRWFASDGVAGQIGGRKNDKRSNVGPERGEPSFVLALGQISFRASTPKNSVTGQTGGRESNRGSTLGCPNMAKGTWEEVKRPSADEAEGQTRVKRQKWLGRSEIWHGGLRKPQLSSFANVFHVIASSFPIGRGFLTKLIRYYYPNNLQICRCWLDDNHDDNWSYGLPLPLAFFEMMEIEKRFWTTNFKVDFTKLSINEWLQDIS